MLATALLLMMLGAQAAPGQTYRDLVALQNRALQPGSPNAAMDHRLSIGIAERLDRPRLLAVLFQRLGRHLESIDVQEAVIAYEAGLRALAREPGFDVERELDRLTRVPKGFSASARAIPADLYSQPLATELDAAEGDPLLPIHLLLDIGNAYFQQPQLEVALDRYRSVLARPEIGKAPTLRAYALANAGEIVRRQGRIDEAEGMLQEALGLFEQHAEKVESRRALVLLAGIHRDRREDGRALAAYSEALALYARTRDPRGEGRAHGGLGRLHLDANRLADARSAFARAIELGDQTKDEQSLWHAHWGLAQVQQRTGDIAGAAASLEKSLTLIEGSQRNLTTDEGRVTFLDSAQQVFEQLVALHLERARSSPGGYGDALRIAERARAGAMRDMMGADGRSGLRCPDRSQTSGPGALEGNGQAAPGTPNPASQMAPATRSPAAQMALGTPTEPIVMGAPDPRCADGRSRTSVTPPPLARLVFHVLGEQTVVFAVRTSGDVQGHVVRVGREALTGRVAAFRDALGVDAVGRGLDTQQTSATPSPTAWRAYAQSLYRDFIAPVADALPRGETVAVEPHGPLWFVPFAALEDEAGRPLIDRWPIVYAPSAQILDEIRRDPPYRVPTDLKALIVGNPTPPNVTLATDDRFRSARLRATFQPLPGAEEEAKAIAALLSTDQRTLLTGGAADLRRIESEMASHTMVHLASHALAFSDGPLDSFVMLAAGNGTDGRLSARRVLGLTISADLITLSACQTGMGYLSGDGVIGLSRAFLVRGARSVLVSQWSVSDTATAALMQGFYRRYLASSGDKARALQQVMNEVRSMPGFEHPKFWAPFVLIGSER